MEVRRVKIADTAPSDWIEIELRGVLQAEHHRMPTYAVPRLGVMLRLDLAPINVFITQKKIGGKLLRAPRLDVGMLAAGWAEKRSVTVFARLFSRLSSKYSPADSLLIPCFGSSDKAPPKRRE
nr:hypothetical protein [Propionivibrio sp.]